MAKQLAILLLLVLSPNAALAGGSLKLDPGMVTAHKTDSDPVPTEANAASYQKICDAYGEGFVYGADGVCVKIGGYVKFGTSGRGSR